MNQRHNLPGLFMAAIRRRPRQKLLGAKQGDQWRWWSSQEALLAIRETAAGLIAVGLKPGDRVALLSENRPEWLISDMAVLFAAGVDVPVYPTLPPDQVAFLLRDSEARFVVVSNGDQARKVLSRRAELPRLEQIYCLDGAVEGTVPASELRVRGRQRLADYPGDLEERLAELGPDSLATIIYTSGTMGTPKGAMLTHGNFCFDVSACIDWFGFEEGNTALSFLPLSHVLERMVNYAYLEIGLQVAYLKGPEQLRDALTDVRPHVFVAVPKVLEIMAARVKDAIEKKTGVARLVAETAMRWAAETAEDRIRGRRPSALRGLRLMLADKVVLARLRERLGGRLRFVISGGAALAPEIERFYWSAGIPVFEGYGMTETSPVIAVAHEGEARLGSVGKPLPGVDVRIAADGEILVRGPNVMTGYWKRPVETEQSLVEGWLRTGDTGRLDADGFLYVTGRKKEILVLSTGKNVAPRAVEESLEKSPYIERVIAVGDERPAVGVLIVPNTDRVLAWAAERNLPKRDLPGLLSSREVRRLYEGEIHRLQDKLAAFEKARRFEFLLDEPSEANGLLTPTQKVRRHEVLRRYSKLVERMYNK